MAESSTANTVRIERIGQVALSVSDLERSRAFYRDTLGLEFLFDAGNMAFLRCGDVRLMLGTSDKPVEAGGTILYYKVADLEAAHGVLVERGVQFFSEPHLVARMPDHDLWMAFLRDPDGYAVGLMCEKARAAA